jgi:hypothetical protein
LLDDPTVAFRLLLGLDVDFFRYDMPEFAVGFELEQSFGPIYAPPPVFVTLEGGLRAGMRFAFGYDTFGLRAYDESVRQGTPEDFLLLEGFYVADTYLVDGEWKDLPELYVRAHIGAGVRVSAVVVSAEVEGGIYAQLGLNLRDRDDDGRMRFSEFLAGLQAGGPFCIYDAEGEFGAYVELEISFGIDLGLFFVGVTVPFTIAEVTLISFELGCEPPPVLATLDWDDGTLYLNMGDRAAFRVNGDLTDGDEAFTVTALGSGSVLVDAFGFQQVYGTLQPFPIGAATAPGHPDRGERRSGQRHHRDRFRCAPAGRADGWGWR